MMSLQLLGLIMMKKNTEIDGDSFFASGASFFSLSFLYILKLKKFLNNFILIDYTFGWNPLSF